MIGLLHTHSQSQLAAPGDLEALLVMLGRESHHLLSVS